MEINVKNNSGKTFKYEVFFSVVYYDKKGNAIRYDFLSASIQKPNSKAVLTSSYPYSYEKSKYINPASYKVYVVSAYSYVAK